MTISRIAVLPSSRCDQSPLPACSSATPSPKTATAGPRLTGADVLADPSAPVNFTIPVPPSVNQAYRNTPRGRAKTKAYDDWLLFAFQSIRQQKVGKIGGHVMLRIGFEREDRRSDLDNRLKLCLDALVAAHVIDDDRFVTSIVCSWLPYANGLAHIEVAPVGPQSIEFHASSTAATGAWTNSAAQLNEGVI